MTPRIVIKMEGGLIQGITSNIPGLEIAVLDYDLYETVPLEENEVQFINYDQVIKTDKFTSDPLFMSEPMNPEEHNYFDQLVEAGW